VYARAPLCRLSSVNHDGRLIGMAAINRTRPNTNSRGEVMRLEGRLMLVNRRAGV
jgi:hypothetical protein